MEPDVEQQRPSRAGTAKSSPAEQRPAAAGGRRRIVFAILGLALLALIAGGVRKLIWARTHESTDNAQVDGHILPVLPKVGGFVTAVRVEENQPVRAGDTLVVIDPRDYQVRLQQADADLAVALATVSSRQRVGQADAAVRQAEAAAQKAHADLDRLTPLAAQGIVSRQQLDAAQTAVRSADAALAAAQAALTGADARVASARAARDQAALQLSYTHIVAPTDGLVSKKTVEVGELVQPGPTAHERRAAAGRVGHGESQGDADRGGDPGRPRGVHRGRLPRRPLPRDRREPVARDGGALLPAPAGQRHRELHEGGAAHPRADPSRRTRGHRSSAAAGDERGRHHHDEVTSA
jgi:biotin carboxyl carrier protein